MIDMDSLLLGIAIGLPLGWIVRHLENVWYGKQTG